MNQKSLQDKTFSSIAWSGSIQIIAQVLNFGLSIILARLLSPTDFGLMATMLVFIGFAQLLSDFGLSTSLIQKDSVNNRDAFSCSVVNAIFGSVFTIALIVCHQQIADFYGEPSLEGIVLAVSPIFVLNSICSVPQALLARELAHKKVALIGLVSLLTGSITAVLFAINDFGVWSLILQQYVSITVKVVLLLYVSKFKWARFDIDVIKSLFNFSANVFLTRLIQQIAQQSDKVLVGKYLGTQDLGLYSRAFHFTTFPINNITRVVNNVMFPALSKIKNNEKRVSDVYLTVIGYVALLTFPTLAGFAYLSEEIIVTLLGEKWLPMQPYFVFFSVIGMVTSIGQMSTPFFLSQGKANLHLKLNLFTQPCKTLFLFIGVQWGLTGIMIAYAVSTFISFTSSIIILMRFVDVTIISMFNTLFKTGLATGLMILSLKTMNSFLYIESQIILLIINSVLGAFSYAILNIIIRNELFFQLYRLIFSKFKKTKLA